jgi:hypothetical protein
MPSPINGMAAAIVQYPQRRGDLWKNARAAYGQFEFNGRAWESVALSMIICSSKIRRISNKTK